MNDAHVTFCVLLLFPFLDPLVVFVLLGPSGSGARPMMSLGSMQGSGGVGMRLLLNVLAGAAKGSNSVSVPSEKGSGSTFERLFVSSDW